MKVNVNGMDMEMTVEEFKQLSEIFGTVKPDVKYLTYDEEWELLHHLKYFKVTNTDLKWGKVKFTIESDLS